MRVYTAGSAWAAARAAAQDLVHRSPAVMYGRSVFEEGLKNGLERRPMRFSTISTKNHLLKLNIDKVTAIRVTQITLLGDRPLYFGSTKVPDTYIALNLVVPTVLYWRSGYCARSNLI